MHHRIRVSALCCLAFLQASCNGPMQVKTVEPFDPKIAVLVCPPSNCKIDVRVRVGEGGICEVSPEYAEIRVKPGDKPKMTWSIKEIGAGHRPYNYQFAYDPSTTPPLYGINIVTSYSAVDFDGPGYDAGDKKKFKWDNKHGRSLPAAPFDYTIHVERSVNNGKFGPCDELDPRIVNE